MRATSWVSPLLNMLAGDERVKGEGEVGRSESEKESCFHSCLEAREN